MALHMFCSNWLVCGWLVSLIVGAGVVILQRPTSQSRLNPLRWSLSIMREGRWDGGWDCYHDLRGQLEDERLQIGRSKDPAGSGRGSADSGWSYAN